MKGNLDYLSKHKILIFFLQQGFWVENDWRALRLVEGKFRVWKEAEKFLYKKKFQTLLDEDWISFKLGSEGKGCRLGGVKLSG